MRATPTARRTILVLAQELAKESAQRWAQVANSLRREGLRELADDADLIKQACGVQAMKHSVALMKVENHLKRLSDKAFKTIAQPGKYRGQQKASEG